jgi:hypothetical protein
MEVMLYVKVCVLQQKPRRLKGNKESDCVTRAISFASDLPYSLIRKKLWLTARLYNCKKLCKFCYSNFITYVLKYKEVNCENLTINEFANRYNNGIYLIRIEGHLTVIKNGVLYDIWDCRDEICDTVWKVE